MGEDPELLGAIISNDDNLQYGTIIYVSTGTDESFNTLTKDGIDELIPAVIGCDRYEPIAAFRLR